MDVQTKFTSEEECLIQEEVEKYKRQSREAEIQAEIMNRVSDVQRNTPGSKYY